MARGLVIFVGPEVSQVLTRRSTHLKPVILGGQDMLMMFFLKESYIWVLNQK